MSREAMKQALEALENDPVSHAGIVSRKQAITALRQALAQRLTQDLEAPLTINGVPLYPKKEWVGLTDEEMEALFLNEDDVRFARYIESRLKDKNA